MLKLWELGDTGANTPPTTVKPKNNKKIVSDKKSPFIDLKPKIREPKNEAFLDEVNMPISQVDYLIRIGLGDPAKITYYRQVIRDPKRAMTNPMLRPYFVELNEKLFNLIFSDSQLYNRLRSILQKQDTARGREREPREEIVMADDMEALKEARFQVQFNDGKQQKQIVVQGRDKVDAIKRLRDRMIKKGNPAVHIGAVKQIAEEAWPDHYFAVRGGGHNGHKYSVVQEGGPHKSYVTARAKAIQHSHIHGGETVHVYRNSGDDLVHSSSHRVGTGEGDTYLPKIRLFDLEAAIGESVIDGVPNQQCPCCMKLIKTEDWEQHAKAHELDELSKVKLSQYVMKAGNDALKGDPKRAKGVSKALSKIKEEGFFVGSDEIVDQYGKQTPGEHDLLARIKKCLAKGNN